MSSVILVRQAVVKQQHADEIGIQSKHRQFVFQLWTNKIMITSMSLLPPQLSYTDWSLWAVVHVHQNISPEMQQSKLEICKGQSKMSWGTTGKNCVQHQLPWLAHSPFPSLCHPRLILSNIWERRSWIFLFSLLLGLLLHSVLPLFIKVPKNTTLAEPGMWRMTRGAQVLQLHHPASISSSSAQLSLAGNGNQAPNSGPRGFIHNTPKCSRPSSTQTHLKFPSFQKLHPKSPWFCPSKPGGQAECQRCSNTGMLGWAKSWTEGKANTKLSGYSIKIKECKQSFEWGTGLVTHLISFLYEKLWECWLHELGVRNWTWDHSASCSKHWWFVAAGSSQWMKRLPADKPQMLLGEMKKYNVVGVILMGTPASFFNTYFHQQPGNKNKIWWLWSQKQLYIWKPSHSHR